MREGGDGHFAPWRGVWALYTLPFGYKVARSLNVNVCTLLLEKCVSWLWSQPNRDTHTLGMRLNICVHVYVCGCLFLLFIHRISYACTLYERMT